ERQLPKRRHRRLLVPLDPDRPEKTVQVDPFQPLRHNHRLLTRPVSPRRRRVALHALENARFSPSRQNQTAVSRLTRSALAYEVLPGNTADCKTLRSFLAKIEGQYGKARRVWVMDRGVPTEEVLAEMRASDPPVSYLVGTPKGRLTRLEKQLVDKPWRKARERVEVKLLAQDHELYVFAQSA